MRKRERKSRNAKAPKRVADLKVADVLKMRLYQDNLKSIMDELETSRRDARDKLLNAREKLKAHPIDKLIDKGIWNCGDFTVLYAQVCDKVAVGYSATERKFISEVGTEAFNKTMITLIEDEKARDNGNGND